MTRVARFDVPGMNNDLEKLDERRRVIDIATEVLGADYPFSGKSLRAIKVAVVQALHPTFDMSNRPDEGVDGAFDGAVLDLPRMRADRASLASTQRAIFDAQSAPTQTRFDAAFERVERKARLDYQAGPPACATVSPNYKRTDASPYDDDAATGDGSKLERADARADERARKEYEAGPPACATVRRD